VGLGGSLGFRIAIRGSPRANSHRARRATLELLDTITNDTGRRATQIISSCCCLGATKYAGGPVRGGKSMFILKQKLENPKTNSTDAKKPLPHFPFPFLELETTEVSKKSSSRTINVESSSRTNDVESSSRTIDFLLTSLPGASKIGAIDL
jgi:hypothetical protein